MALALALALARHWHLFFAWIFAFGLLAHLVVGLVNRHIVPDLALSRADPAPAHLWQDAKDHARLKFPPGRRRSATTCCKRLPASRSCSCSSRC